MPDSAPLPVKETPRALIDAGIRLFGTQGFDATSVRQLANEAGANIAAIAYHFGSKDGLRLACADEFGRRMGQAMTTTQGKPHPSPPDARQELHRIVRAMLGFLLDGAEAGGMVPFMLRELAENGPGVDAVYRGFAEPMHRRLCTLWATATGTDGESEAVRLAVFSLIGQIMYFRIGQPVVARRMGWETTGPVNIDQISRTIIRNLDAMLDAQTGP